MVPPFKEWELPLAIRRVRKKLERLPGGDRQMVDILGVILTDGLEQRRCLTTCIPQVSCSTSSPAIANRRRP